MYLYVFERAYFWLPAWPGLRQVQLRDREAWMVDVRFVTYMTRHVLRQSAGQLVPAGQAKRYMYQAFYNVARTLRMCVRCAVLFVLGWRCVSVPVLATGTFPPCLTSAGWKRRRSFRNRYSVCGTLPTLRRCW